MADKEFEDFLKWETKSSTFRPDIFYSFNDNQIDYYSKTISWKNLLVVYQPDNETVFDGLFRDLFSDSIFNKVDRAELRKQYDDEKKNVKIETKHLESVKWTDKRKRNKPTISYSSPILILDNRLLIVCKDYSLNNGNATIRGEYYVNVYKRTKDGWEFYKSSGATY